VIDPALSSRRRGDRARRYDPWSELAVNWPGAEVVVRPMRGTLLGELRYPVIALRAGTSAGQRRCTLTHEIVHLERGVTECGPWAAREERRVELTVAERLLPVDVLVATIRDAGGADHPGTLARLADVDLDTWLVRLGHLSRPEQAALARAVRSLDRAA
jgi:hypothetical protein